MAALESLDGQIYRFPARGRMGGGSAKGRRRASPGTLRRRLQEWAEANPWAWLGATIVITWASIFGVWVGVFYFALTVVYQTFSSGIDPQRTLLVIISGSTLASVVAPLFGITWALKLKRELAALKELEEHVAETNERERKERERSEEREKARASSVK